MAVQGSKVSTDTKSYTTDFYREIIFKSFQFTTKAGVQHPVEIITPFWNSMKISEDKGSILLTKEEE